MSLKGFDSGEATRFPTFAERTTSSTWTKVTNQPSAWSVISSSANSAQGVAQLDPFTGVTHFRIQHAATGALSAMRRAFSAAALSEAYLSFMVKPISQAIGRPFFSLTTSAGAIVVRLNFDNNCQNILVYVGTTPTLKATIPIAGAGQWYNVKLHTKVAGDIVDIRINDGADVACHGTAHQAWLYVVLGDFASVNAPGSHNYDCIQVNDVAGTINNSWPGTPQIPEASHADGDTGATDWTRSSGSNDFDMVKELEPDLDATYVFSTVNGDLELFELEDVSNPLNTAIRAVCLNLVAKRADTASLIPVLSRGGITVELDPIPVGPDYMTPIEVILEQDPIAVGDWTQGNFNATIFGFRHLVT